LCGVALDIFGIEITDEDEKASERSGAFSMLIRHFSVQCGIRINPVYESVLSNYFAKFNRKHDDVCKQIRLP
jgi:hypothetical protein